MPDCLEISRHELGTTPVIAGASRAGWVSAQSGSCGNRNLTGRPTQLTVATMLRPLFYSGKRAVEKALQVLIYTYLLEAKVRTFLNHMRRAVNKIDCNVTQEWEQS